MYQVGRVNKNGISAEREMKAIEDIMNQMIIMEHQLISYHIIRISDQLNTNNVVKGSGKVMGRQINFYIEKELEHQFMQFVFNKGYIIGGENLRNKQLIVFKNVKDIDPKIYSVCLYKEEYGQLIVENDCDYRIDYNKSPVIEFTDTFINYEEKSVMRGRMWMQPKHYDEHDNVVSKDLRLTKDCTSFVRWIKKYALYQEITKGKYIVKEYISENMKPIANSGFRLM